MRNRVVIHPDYTALCSSIAELPNNFVTIRKTIFSGRNHVKEVNFNGYRLAVKSYKKITIANRFIYATLRKSKAQRAYENALKLIDLDVATPLPIAYVDCFEGLFLSQSYFVSLYVEHKPLEEILLNAKDEKSDILAAFAQFTRLMHEKGIMHKDFHLNNVLLKTDSNQLEFCIIDINRMTFKKMNKYQAMRSLKKIHLPLEEHAAFIAEYAHQAKLEPYKTFKWMVFYKFANKRFLSLKKSLKSIVVKRAS